MKKNKDSSKDYRENLKIKAANGDVNAQMQLERTKYNRYRSSAKSFILNKLKEEDVSNFEKYIIVRKAKLKGGD